MQTTSALQCKEPPLIQCTPSQLRARICALVPDLKTAAALLWMSGVDGRQLMGMNVEQMHAKGLTLTDSEHVLVLAARAF